MRPLPDDQGKPKKRRRKKVEAVKADEKFIATFARDPSYDEKYVQICDSVTEALEASAAGSPRRSPRRRTARVPSSRSTECSRSRST